MSCVRGKGARLFLLVISLFSISILISSSFSKVEGLVADYDLTLGNLIGIIRTFFEKIGSLSIHSLFADGNRMAATYIEVNYFVA